jgi:ACS family tartrate transporter-like MFS transporter
MVGLLPPVPSAKASEVGVETQIQPTGIERGTLVGSSAADGELERATLRRVNTRLLSLLFPLYIANYLDRTNVSLAALQMNQDLGLSAAAYGLGSGIFFVGYALFEVPSNLILARVGARRWIARIALTWGILACAMMFVRGPRSFFTVRFLLGFAEAGFFPGIVYYFGDWFPQRYRARAIASFMAAVPLSSALGGPLGGSLLALRGRLGLAGWQWLFLVEAIPSILLGLVVLLYLTDRPENATWLSDDQRSWLRGRLDGERLAAAESSEANLVRALGSRVLWQLTAAYLLGLCAWLGVLYFAPVILRDGLGIGTTAVGFTIGALGLFGLVGMLWNGAHSDSSGERVLHTALPSMVLATGLLIAALLPGRAALIAGFALMYLGANAFLPAFWCVPTALLRGTAAAGGIAVINAIGNLGGFFAPSFLGALKDRTGTFTSGLVTLSVVAVASAILVLPFRARATRANESLAGG